MFTIARDQIICIIISYFKITNANFIGEFIQMLMVSSCSDYYLYYNFFHVKLILRYVFYRACCFLTCSKLIQSANWLKFRSIQNVTCFCHAKIMLWEVFDSIFAHIDKDSFRNVLILFLCNHFLETFPYEIRNTYFTVNYWSVSSCLG